MSFLSALIKWGHNRHYNRGIEHFNRGEFERAAECFEAALAEVRDPNDPDHTLARCHAAEARANLGLASLHAGDHSRAETEFRRSLAENPDYPDLRFQLARICERSGRLPEALGELEQALAQHPRYVEAHLLRAVCLGQLGDGPGAAAALETAVSLGLEPPAGPGTPAPGWGQADWRALGGRIGATRGMVGTGSLDQALARYHAGDLDGAIEGLTRAVSERPNYADLRTRLAGLLLEQGRGTESLAHLSAALELNPRYLEARMLAARAHLERGEADAAVDHLERA
ncbi:MAG TPA: tetratricopeptide repeat protein, partial [Dongiaceae bacterium]|nr:tetratricopeptide repeat protein [Dongiaceae bacterium]